MLSDSEDDLSVPDVLVSKDDDTLCRNDENMSEECHTVSDRMIVSTSFQDGMLSDDDEQQQDSSCDKNDCTLMGSPLEMTSEELRDDLDEIEPLPLRVQKHSFDPEKDDVLFELHDVTIMRDEFEFEDFESHYVSTTDDVPEFNTWDDGITKKKTKPTSWFKKRFCTVFLHGNLESGETVCVKYLGYRPFFYLTIPEKGGDKIQQKKWMDSFLKEFSSSTENLPVKEVASTQLVYKIPSTGFRNGEPIPLILFQFNSLNAFFRYRHALQKRFPPPTQLDVKNGNYRNEIMLCEDKIPHDTKFCNSRNVQPSGWVKLSAGTFHKWEGIASERIMHTFFTRSIEPVADKDELADTLIDSCDIEVKRDDGKPMLPESNNNGDAIVSIAHAFESTSRSFPRKYYVFTWGTTEVQIPTVDRKGIPIPKRDVIIRRYITEESMLVHWTRWRRCIKISPDCMIGWNLYGFDLGYIFTRIDFLPRIDSAIKKDILEWGRLKGYTTVLSENVIESTAISYNKYQLTPSSGNMFSDLLGQFQRDGTLHLHDYQLGTVSEALLGKYKDDVRYWEIKPLFHGSPTDRGLMIAYNLQDTDIVMDLFFEKAMWSTFMNICRVNLVFINSLWRGQQIRVFSGFHKNATDDGYVVWRPHYHPILDEPIVEDPSIWKEEEQQRIQDRSDESFESTGNVENLLELLVKQLHLNGSLENGINTPQFSLVRVNDEGKRTEEDIDIDRVTAIFSSGLDLGTTEEEDKITTDTNATINNNSKTPLNRNLKQQQHDTSTTTETTTSGGMIPVADDASNIKLYGRDVNPFDRSHIDMSKKPKTNSGNNIQEGEEEKQKEFRNKDGLTIEEIEALSRSRPKRKYVYDEATKTNKVINVVGKNNKNRKKHKKLFESTSSRDASTDYQSLWQSAIGKQEEDDDRQNNNNNNVPKYRHYSDIQRQPLGKLPKKVAQQQAGAEDIDDGSESNGGKGFAGGFVMDPEVGAYENVVIEDYNALYPNIMMSNFLDASNVVIDPRFANCPGVTYLRIRFNANKEFLIAQKPGPMIKHTRNLVNSRKVAQGLMGCFENRVDYCRKKLVSLLKIEKDDKTAVIRKKVQSFLAETPEEKLVVPPEEAILLWKEILIDKESNWVLREVIKATFSSEEDQQKCAEWPIERLLEESEKLLNGTKCSEKLRKQLENCKNIRRDYEHQIQLLVRQTGTIVEYESSNNNDIKSNSIGKRKNNNSNGHLQDGYVPFILILLGLLNKYERTVQNYNGRQLQLKLGSNATFGFYGAGGRPTFSSVDSRIQHRAMLPVMPIPACVTYIGRHTIEASKEYVEKNYPGSKVIYADTDSLFIVFPKDLIPSGIEGLDATFPLAKKVAQEITNLWNFPGSSMCIVHEKTARILVIYSAKCYAMDMYTKVSSLDPGKLNIKGLSFSKRDCCKLAASMCNSALETILRHMGSNNIRKAQDEITQKALDFVDDILRESDLKSLRDTVLYSVFQSYVVDTAILRFIKENVLPKITFDKVECSLDVSKKIVVNQLPKILESILYPAFSDPQGRISLSRLKESFSIQPQSSSENRKSTRHDGFQKSEFLSRLENLVKIKYRYEKIKIHKKLSRKATEPKLSPKQLEELRLGQQGLPQLIAYCDPKNSSTYQKDQPLDNDGKYEYYDIDPYDLYDESKTHSTTTTASDDYGIASNNNGSSNVANSSHLVETATSLAPISHSTTNSGQIPQGLVAHAQLAHIIEQRKPGLGPKPGESVGYIYYSMDLDAYQKRNHKKLIQSNHVKCGEGWIEDFEYAVEKDLTIDKLWYLENQILKNVRKVFQPLMQKDPSILLRDAINKQQRKRYGAKSDVQEQLSSIKNLFGFGDDEENQ